MSELETDSPTRTPIGLGAAFSLPGCLRAAAAGFGLLFAFLNGAPSPWKAVPVDFEPSTNGPTAQDDVRRAHRAEVEALLRGYGFALPERQRVARAVVEEAEAAGFDPLFVMAVVHVESEGEQQAVSPKGARGLMQIRPQTLRFVDDLEGIGLPLGLAGLDDPALNIRLGTRYLKRLTRAFGDVNVALVAYNGGPHLVSKLLRARAPIPHGMQHYALNVRRAYGRLTRRFRNSNDVSPIDWTPTRIAERPT
jgi:soluble lytic murein transglycosylase-like protein